MDPPRRGPGRPRGTSGQAYYCKRCGRRGHNSLTCIRREREGWSSIMIELRIRIDRRRRGDR